MPRPGAKGTILRTTLQDGMQYLLLIGLTIFELPAPSSIIGTKVAVLCGGVSVMLQGMTLLQVFHCTQHRLRYSGFRAFSRALHSGRPAEGSKSKNQGNFSKWTHFSDFSSVQTRRYAFFTHRIKHWREFDLARLEIAIYTSATWISYYPPFIRLWLRMHPPLCVPFPTVVPLGWTEIVGYYLPAGVSFVILFFYKNKLTAY